MVLTAAALLAGCLTRTPQAPGVLEGTVTIGPISPVETPGVQPPVPCTVYEARKVIVSDARGTKLIQQVDIDCQGHYRAEFAPGTYTIDINHAGIDRSPDVPAKIMVESGETVTLDIDIDTGIR